jgi:hypothetical protein
MRPEPKLLFLTNYLSIGGCVSVWIITSTHWEKKYFQTYVLFLIESLNDGAEQDLRYHLTGLSDCSPQRENVVNSFWIGHRLLSSLVQFSALTPSTGKTYSRTLSINCQSTTFIVNTLRSIGSHPRKTRLSTSQLPQAPAQGRWGEEERHCVLLEVAPSVFVWHQKKAREIWHASQQSHLFLPFFCWDGQAVVFLLQQPCISPARPIPMVLVMGQNSRMRVSVGSNKGWEAFRVRPTWISIPPLWLGSYVMWHKHSSLLSLSFHAY